ncbi:MAG TPA: glycosyltransferase family 4 protein [Roseiflexaceae bacterium]|nr:glycosyltransferase family 4 protein [Roseiflexaceae bacterium]
MTPYRIGFVMEQALGHVTHTRNLQAQVARDTSIEAQWALIPQDVHGFAGRIPVYKSNWTVRAGLRARHALAGLERVAHPDALFFHTQVPSVLASDWVRRVPSVISLDATPRQYDELGLSYGHKTSAAWLEHLKWRLNRDCFAAAQQLVTWSHWAKRGLVDAYEVPADKITVIPPGVEVEAWANPDPRRVHDGPVKILFIGGDLRRKGGALLLQSFRKLRHLNIELHLVTHEQMREEPGLFVYNNVQPNSVLLKQLAHNCDIFCLPTYGDCLPMVLSEAGAAGLPLVSTDVAAIPEIVHDGENGFVVPVGSTVALTDALRRLIENPELRLQQGARAAALVRETFDVQRNAQHLLALLKDVADTARPVRRAA